MQTLIWEFKVKSGCEREFESLYGPQGDWVHFFQRGEGYLGTELLCDMTVARRYVTIDRWRSRDHYETFHARWQKEYRALDLRFEALTERETPIGSFLSLGSSSRPV